jgi:uncharacterized protein (TIGR01777 family)
MRASKSFEETAMRILITGGTGLIGRHLCKVLLAEGHQLTVLSRHPATVAVKCGATVQAMAALSEWLPDRTFDAVINLAGEPIVDEYWSARRKQVLRESRITLTEKLVQCIAAARQKPKVLLSGSAIGYYGDRGDTELDEAAPAGKDFAAELCKDWEESALTAEKHGVRVCLLRTGLVLSKSGGLLGRMMLPFRLGLGARLGNGRQWMSWIHIEDYVASVLRLLNDDQMRGPFNMTAPQPVTNAEFTRTLAKSLHRPAFLFAPEPVLRLAMGERAALLVEGQRVLPAKLVAAGGQFRYPDLAGALDDLLHQ